MCQADVVPRGKGSVMWQWQLEMANKPVPVGITRTRPRFDGESPL